MADLLIVSSKVKKFIQEKAKFNTSQEFIEALSKRVEGLCLDATEQARRDKRKTVKARDL